MKQMTNVYIDMSLREDLETWAEEFKTSRSGAAAAAIEVGLRHKEEMYNKLNENWRKRYAF